MNKEELATAFAKFLEDQGKAQPKEMTAKEAASHDVLEYIRNNPGSTADDVSRGLKISQGKFYYVVKLLKKDNSVVVIGSYIKRYYLAGTVDMQEVQDQQESASDRILQFVSDNVDKSYSIRDMSNDLKIPLSTVQRYVASMKKRKLIPENFKDGSEPLHPSKAPKKPAAPVVKTPAKAIGSLIWEFVRETRSTDVLQFLTWLENK